MDCLELIYRDKYFNPTKIFVLNVFRMAENQTEYSRIEQRSVIKYLEAEKCKPCEIYRRMGCVWRSIF